MKQLFITAFILAAVVACAPGRAPSLSSRKAGVPTNASAAAPALDEETGANEQTSPTEEPEPTATPMPDATATPANPLGRILTPAGASIPNFKHIYLIVMENKEYRDIVGDPNAHYINDLIEHYGLATDYTAVAHPSQPNYFALFSGSTQGINDDSRHTVSATNLVDQLEGQGKTWKIYQQNYPSQCFTGMSASGGSDGGGQYLRRHNPAISFTDVASNSGRCANIVDFGQFDPMAADFEMIVANSCNDMHDCAVSDGDSFLQQFIPQITNSDGFKNDGVILITWDEGTTSKGGGGQVPTIVLSNRVPAGFKSSTPHNHYSLLRTIEDAWNLGCLQQTCSANNLGEFFH